MFDVPDFLLGFLAGVVMAMLLNLSVPYRHFRERRKLEAESGNFSASPYPMRTCAPRLTSMIRPGWSSSR